MVDEVLIRAARLAEAGRIDEAAMALAEALRHDGRLHEARYQLGMLEARRGNLAEAEQLARAATTAREDLYASGLGHILAKAGKLEEAQKWLRRAIELDSKNAWAHANLGAVYGDQQKLGEALACMEEALSIQPDFPWAQASRERLLSERNFRSNVRATYVEFARKRSLDPDPDAAGDAELEFHSAATDADGNPRFVMDVPTSLIFSDLGAAHLFFREVAGRGYEFGLRQFLDLQLLSDDVFIDVGAHWGLHSLTAATRWPKQVSVLAIEAHPENVARLRKWVALNQLEAEIEVIPKAVGVVEGTAYLQVNGSSMGHRLGTDGIRST